MNQPSRRHFGRQRGVEAAGPVEPGLAGVGGLEDDRQGLSVELRITYSVSRSLGSMITSAMLLVLFATSWEFDPSVKMLPSWGRSRLRDGDVSPWRS
jgi:hypothetical protein